MKMTGNCRQKEGHCPFSKNPTYHSGYTGKSGVETWFWCDYWSKPIRHIRTCTLAGDYARQRETFISERSE